MELLLNNGCSVFIRLSTGKIDLRFLFGYSKEAEETQN